MCWHVSKIDVFNSIYNITSFKKNDLISIWSGIEKRGLLCVMICDSLINPDFSSDK
jgi:hypothetical protein